MRFVAAVLFLWCSVAIGQTRVVGYLPEYRAKDFDRDSLKQLTDLIVFSAAPTADGKVDLSPLKDVPLEALRSFKNRAGIRLILCIGGKQRSANFAVVASTQRQVFIKSCVAVCVDQRFDGLDFDWEYPKDQAEETAYGLTLKDLRAALPQGKILSLTISAFQKTTPDAFASADYVQVMSYDHKDRHSTLEDAEADIKTLLARGVPANKLVLGIPFYGSGIVDRGTQVTYRQLVAIHDPLPEVDQVEGVYFNGPDLVRRKAELAVRSGLAGVFVWEVGQDAPGERSLLKVIRKVIPK